MEWDYPSWWSFLLLMLAAYRVWRLLALDAVFDRWRRPFLRRLPEKLHEGFQCPYCFGAWVVAGWWLAWIIAPRWALVVATPFALSGALGVFAAHLDPEQ